MDKIDFVVNFILIVLFVALAVGSFGAFFWGWRWHLILLGMMSAYIAIGMIGEFVKETKKTEKGDK